MSRAERARPKGPVGYNYSFFHLIFALASMYVAMLMTGWGTGPEGTDRIDVGWTSVWVKVASQWMTAALYRCAVRRNRTAPINPMTDSTKGAPLRIASKASGTYFPPLRLS